jgi:glyoxylase-like metal-dependent hydrolase (beta-lactamase superfamily II)/rhodanese-related sulfurtransferase
LHFHQFYLGCLAHASYLVGSNGEAAVVDPQRDVDQYIDEAARHDLKIRWIIETHLHADFVSGHAELARRTGAEIVFGAAAHAEFPHRAVRDGDELRVGDVVLRALETPGHTPESISWVVIEDDAPRKVLTGDTLFIGDVGRPDLAGSRGWTSEQMASLLYDSLHEKILALDDAVEVWPAHGAGSACGKNISRERSSTIGAQRRMNYALKPMPREAFVAMMTTDLPPAPRYFPMDAEINRRGARALDEVTAPQLAAIPDGAIVLDVRDDDAFASAHIPDSIHIGLGGQYASWAGTLLRADQPIVVVAEPANVKEAIVRLARVGLETVIGWIDFASWTGPFATLPQITVQQLHESELTVLDVRRGAEFAAGHVPHAINVPLDILPDAIASLPRKPMAIICASGYRSLIAASLLARAGFTNLRNVKGGTGGWVRAGYGTTS